MHEAAESDGGCGGRGRCGVSGGVGWGESRQAADVAVQGFLVRAGLIQAVAQLWGRSWVGGFQHEGIWASGLLS